MDHVQVGYWRLQGGSDDFWWHTSTQTLHHNISIITILIIIIMLPNIILILIIVSNQSSSLAGLNVTICLHPRPPTASSTTTNHSRFFFHLTKVKVWFCDPSKLDPEFFCLWVFLGLRTFSAPRLFLILVCVRKLSPGRLFVPPPYKPLGLPNKKLMLEDIILNTFLGNILALYYVLCILRYWYWDEHVKFIPDICQFWNTTILFSPVKVHQKVRKF